MTHLHVVQDRLPVEKIDLSTEAACVRACSLDCTTFYTDTAPGDTPAIGNFIYHDSSCDCGEGPFPETLVYSDKCGNRSGNCYTVTPSTCEISGISTC